MDDNDYVPAFRTIWIIAAVILTLGTVYFFYSGKAALGFAGSNRYGHGAKGYLNAYGLLLLTFLFWVAGIGIFWPVKKKNKHKH